jgi:hypothetical protein
MVVIIERSDSVSVLGGYVDLTDGHVRQFCIETLTVDLLIPLVEIHVMDGFTRVSVAPRRIIATATAETVIWKKRRTSKE